MATLLQSKTYAANTTLTTKELLIGLTGDKYSEGIKVNEKFAFTDIAIDFDVTAKDIID